MLELNGLIFDQHFTDSFKQEEVTAKGLADDSETDPGSQERLTAYGRK
jgi:hypothetical protein